MSSPPPIELEVEVGDDTMEVDAPDMLPGERYTLPQADVVLDSWRTKMSEGVLAATHFLDHWRVTVPRIYSPQPNRTCLDWQFDEELASKLLIQPLEHFVLGNSDGTLPTPRRSTLCGRVFKQGEPAYSCRECGMDNTCVLCVECFKVSAHRNHKYKMGQSGGGGCCDCGDTEAWKRDAFCDLHKAPSDESEQDASINPEMIERMKIVASSVLSYCFRLLTHDHAPGLPNDLRLKDAERDPLQILDQPDCYCTVLYNDETHTFEQVISTLTRVTKCNHRDSVELVSLIDREGRALVKCSSFHVCDKLKSDIEMFTARHGPCLKVLVMHAHLVAHQMFAMKLLQWLQNLVGVEVGLRVTVGRVVLSAEGGATGVMLNDHRMWKAARTLWHRLLITTTLMDYDSKKQLAVLFTKNYASMLKDFIRDDHDHSFSISSLSVQLFTTPTLAHYLIAKHDALFIVLNTFISECNRCCNDKGRLEFDRNRVTMSFKRAQFILYDVKYLLSSIPTSYDDDLRKGFLHGLTIMLNLLVMMQGMDSVVRQVGQHTEYEPEWEGAFNLHVKLAHSISLALEWCGQDRIVLASAFRTALRRLSDAETFDVKLLRELGNKSASVIPYDVSSKPVSIHRPLSRFIAGLYLMLDKHGLNYHSKELARPDKPKPTPEELIEPVFRTMAMIAQVQAGMWRRNGFALLNQLYFYHNVKCRAEMLDRDIVMLQIGASLIESNEFIIHMLNKFDLLEWAASDFEQRGIEDDSLRHTISLVEEFLGLLITIIGSRYVPGVGEVTSEERTKKEIIQILCVNPMAHSELNKSLPEDQLHETGLEAVIHDVADFSKPKGNTRGLYTLKPHLYDDYDTFYYHYTREDLSKSEEAQRNRRKAAGLSECCPPPVLPALCPPFRLIASLLQSETSLHVIKTVLQRTLDLRARSFSETQLHKALHLIGYGLRDQESSNYEFVAFAECLQRTGIYEMLIQVAHSQRVEAHQPLAHWLLAKIRSLLGIEDKSSGDVEAMETEKQDKLDTEESAAETEKARRAKLAADRRAAVLAQMQAAQNSFISQNASLFVESEMKEVSEREEVGEGGKVFGGYGVEAQRVERICIMCQEEAEVEFSDDPLVLVAFVQPSTVLRRDSSIRSQPLSAVLPEGIGQALHVSSCGHALHSTCCKKYVDSFVDREKRRPYRLRQPAAFDVEKREYLCPLCERLCNSVLPMVPAPAILSSPAAPLSQEIYQTSVDLVLNHQIMSQSVHLCNESCEDIHCTARARSVGAASSDMDTGDDSAADDPPIYISSHSKDLVPKEFLYNFDMYTPEYPDPLVALIEEFIFNLTQSKVTTETGSLASTAALYKTIAYTILSTDAVFQAEKRPLLGELPARHKDALHSLVRLGAALPTIWKYPHRIAHHAVTSLEVLEKTSPVTQTSFSTLVTVVLSIPSLFAQNSEPAKPNNLARQITLQGLRSTITRALIVANIDECISSNEECPEDLENLLTVTKGVRKGTLKDGLSPTKVWESIKTQCLRFLRCCCLFYHFLSDVTLPPELTVLNGETFEGMCAYLDMPTSFKELIDNEFALKKVFEWSAMSYDLPDSVKQIAVEPMNPPSLIHLPDDYSELMNIVSEFSCPNSEREDSKYPTMCLVCGQILCSQSYCCQQEIRKSAGRGEPAGAAVLHCRTCGGGCGLFLRVRDCELLLLNAPSRGALLPAPYLDLYGETDQGLRRGNPLHLCPERYEKIRMLWLSHGVYERIARSLDTNMLVTRQWQDM